MLSASRSPSSAGIRNTVAAARLCEAAGVRYRLGAAVGSRLLSGFAVQLACSLPGVDYACELGEFERLLGDPFTGLAVVDGHLHLPPAPVSASPQARDAAVRHQNDDRNSLTLPVL